MDVRLWHVPIVLVTLATLTGLSRADDDSKEVIATGQGLTVEAARRDGLRRALEEGGRHEIASHSGAKHFALIRDTIYARADGVIRAYRVMDEGTAADGARYCKLTATISKASIASNWGYVQSALDRVGRPGVAVLIHETIDGALQESSALESQLEKRLVDAGFVVYAGTRLRTLVSQESTAEGEVAKVQAIAKEFNAPVFIVGTASADAVVNLYHTDTAALIERMPLSNWRGGAGGTALVSRCHQAVLKHWASRVIDGREISLEVKGLTVPEATVIKKKLKSIDPDLIIKVNYSATIGVVWFRIRARMTAEELVEHLAEGEWPSILDPFELQGNTIRARKIGP